MRGNFLKIKFGEIFELPVKNGIYKSPEFQGRGIRIINMGELFNYNFIGNQDMNLVELTEKEYQSNCLENGDLLFARRSVVEDGAGKVSIIKNNNKKLTFESSIIRVRLDCSKAFSLFYYYYFSSSVGKAIMSAITSGTNVKGIKGSDLKSRNIILPPLETQKKIASILSGYDDLIENNLKRIKILEEMAQQTYEEWFVRMRFPGHETAEMNVETGLPEGWEKVKLGDLWEIQSSKRIFLSDYVDSGIPFFRGKEITQKSENYTISDLIYIREDKFKEIKKKYGAPSTNDILITAVGTLGNLYMVRETDEDFYFKDGNLIWFKSNDNYSSYYLFYYLKSTSFQNYLSNTAIGSSQKALTIKGMKESDIIKPSKDLIDSFDEIIIPISKSIENLQNQNQRLRETRDILLPRLMMGMVEV